MRREFSAEVVAAIRRLHGENPELGHEGIGRLLADGGFKVDEYDLRKYMAEHKLTPGRTATWKSKLFHRGPWVSGD